MFFLTIGEKGTGSAIMAGRLKIIFLLFGAAMAKFVPPVSCFARSAGKILRSCL
jgi:hypothetical protein